MEATMTIRTGSRRRALAPVAIGAGLTGLLLMLFGTYVDTPYRSVGAGPWAINTEGRGIGELALLIVFAVAGAAVVFGVVVDRGLRLQPERTAARSLIVAVVGAASLVVFWAGLPAVLAAAAGVLALDARARLGRTPAAAGGALILAASTVVVAVWLAISG
jgi:hypothetical protein